MKTETETETQTETLKTETETVRQKNRHGEKPGEIYLKIPIVRKEIETDRRRDGETEIVRE